MSKSMKILRYITAFAALLFLTAYILKILGVSFFASLGNWVLLPFWVLIAANMILIYLTQRKAKDSEDNPDS